MCLGHSPFFLESKANREALDSTACGRLAWPLLGDDTLTLALAQEKGCISDHAAEFFVVSASEVCRLANEMVRRFGASGSRALGAVGDLLRSVVPQRRDCGEWQSKRSRCSKCSNCP